MSIQIQRLIDVDDRVERLRDHDDVKFSPPFLGGEIADYAIIWVSRLRKASGTSLVRY